ncbi:MAG: N-acetylmuramic acid 6-phosphate etherase [Armatimonadetes bacterium]|nr:N-acetylmuramic acid 6-phosphate etherase [Armatimonadota bacterium]
MSTEARNPRSYGLDKMSAQEIIHLMNLEEQAVMRAMQSAEDGLAQCAEKVAEAFLGGHRTIYVGAGTSGRIATMDAAEMPPTFGLDPERFIALQAGGNAAAARAVEDAEDSEFAAIQDLNSIGLKRGDVLVGIAASGRTPYVLASIRHAQQKGVWTCGISNNANAPLLSEADLGVLLETGPEVLTGSTRLKAGTAQKLALNRISTTAMVLAGKVIENLMVDVKAKNVKLKERCVRIVRDLSTATEDEAHAALEQVDWNVRAALNHLSSIGVSV